MLKAGQHNCKQVHTIDSTCHLELPLGGRDVSGDAEVGRGRLQRVFSTTKAHISAKKKNGVAEHSSVVDPKIQPYAKARRSIGMTEEETSRRNQASAHVSQFLCQRAPTCSVSAETSEPADRQQGFAYQKTCKVYGPCANDLRSAPRNPLQDAAKATGLWAMQQAGIHASYIQQTYLHAETICTSLRPLWASIALRVLPDSPPTLTLYRLAARRFVAVCVYNFLRFLAS